MCRERFLTLTCGECGREFQRNPGPGRPPSRCPECRARPRSPRPAPDRSHWVDAAARWSAGETYEQVGADYGVQRERVRQWVTGVLGKEGVARIKAEHHAAVVSRNVEQRAARLATKPVMACVVCGVEYRALRESQDVESWYRFCPEHRGRNIVSNVGRLISPVRYEGHRRAVRRLGGYNSPAKYEGRWAVRVARGTNRHLVQGSAIYNLVLEARRKDWPLWDAIPPEVRGWVERHLRGELAPSRTSPERTCKGCGCRYRGTGQWFCTRSCYLAHQRERARG